MLWGRAGGRCSFPSCRKYVFHDEEEADTPTLIGENCHIVAEKDDGPRGDPSMPLEQRNSYSNLILLCRNHHKVIDDFENGEVIYSVEKLQQMKELHEEWVRHQLGFDLPRQQDDERYAQIIDGWEKLCHVDEWLVWSSNVLSSGQPSIVKEIDEDLKEARRWLLTRVWPGRYADLEGAFENFRRVLEDFYNVFHKHFAESGGCLTTKKFYKIDEWDEERYNYLSCLYDYHVDLVQDLMLELTRSANLICDLIRKHVVQSYRRDSGRLLVQSGPHMDLSFKEWVEQYRGDERLKLMPYEGLEKFLEQRASRSTHFGEGQPPQPKPKPESA